MLGKTNEEFPFDIDDVVLAKCDKEVYYAKILSINHLKKLASLLFDDNSKEKIEFCNIFSVNETTSDIICVICKEDRSDSSDEIVLCDKCNVGFHQKCHEPHINSKVLAPDVPWDCCFCKNNKQNPYIAANPFNKTNEEGSKNIKENEDHGHILSWYKDDKKYNKKMQLERECNIQWYQTNEKTKEEQTNKNEKKDCEITKKSDSSDDVSKEETSNLNHTDTSAFEKVNKSNSLPTQPLERSVPLCTHHDMVNSNSTENQTLSNNIRHCSHSDVFYEPLSKTLKVNRVSPMLRNNIDSPNNLIIDLDSSDHTVIKSSKLKNKRVDTNKDNKNECLPSKDSRISQQRYALDLPRYNWLMDRLVEENKLDRREVEKQEAKLNQTNNELKEKDIQIVRVESLLKIRVTDTEQIKPQSTLTEVAGKSNDNLMATNPYFIKKLRQSPKQGDSVTNADDNNSRLNSPPLSISPPQLLYKKYASIAKVPLVKTATQAVHTSNHEDNIKKTHVIDEVKYDSLSKEVYNIRPPESDRYTYMSPDITKPLLETNKGLYKAEKEKYNDSHRSKSSIPSLNISVEETRLNQANSDENVRRRIEMQRQLENQRKWIDEHNTRFSSKPNLITTTIHDPRNIYQNKEALVKRSTAHYVPTASIENENIHYDMQRSRQIKQQQEFLEQRLSLYQREMNELQRQKQLLAAQAHLTNSHDLTRQHQKLVVRDTQLRTMEENRKKQSLEMLRTSAQSYVPRHRLNQDQYNRVRLVNNFQVVRPTYNNMLSPEQQLNKLRSATPSLSDKEMILLRETELPKSYIRPNNLPRPIGYIDEPHDTQLINQMQMEHDDMIKKNRLLEMGQHSLTERSKSLYQNYQNTQTMEIMELERLRQRKISPTGSFTLPGHYIQTTSIRELPPKEFKERLRADKPLSDIRYGHTIYIENDLKRRSSEPAYTSPQKVTKVYPLSNSLYSPHSSFQPLAYQSDSQTMLSNNTNLAPMPLSRINDPKLPCDSPTSRSVPRNLDHVNSSDMKRTTTKRTCKLCDKEAQYLCSGCRVAWYCSEECQLSGWKTHSKLCNKDIHQ